MADPVYRPIIALVLGVFRALGLRIRTVGLEHLPPSGGMVLAINHVSYLDFALAGRAILPTGRLVRFMAKKEIFDVPVLGWLMRGMKHIRVDRSAGAGAYLEAVRALQSGEIVGVFPEATISLAFEIKAFKTGAARMARDADVPIVPMVIWGGQRVWTKFRRPQLRHRRVPVLVTIGAPINASGDPDQTTQQLRSAMQAMLEQVHRDYPDSPVGQWWGPARLGGTAPPL